MLSRVFVLFLVGILPGCGLLGIGGSQIAIEQLGHGPNGFRVENLTRGDRHRQYVVFLPQDYTAAGEKRYPTIIFLHTLGDGGSDPRDALRTGLAPYVANKRDIFPFIVIFPQSTDSRWDAESENARDVVAELDAVSGKYRVDPARVYLTGIGTGGTGTWVIGAKYPERFAALVPMCSTWKAASLTGLAGMPIHAYRSHDGDFFSVDNEEGEMVRAAVALGAKAQFIETPTSGVGCWEYVYGDGGMFEWLKQQTRRGAEVVDTGADGKLVK